MQSDLESTLLSIICFKFKIIHVLIIIATVDACPEHSCKGSHRMNDESNITNPNLLINHISFLGQTFRIPWFTTIFFKDQMLGVGIKIKIKCLIIKIYIT